MTRWGTGETDLREAARNNGGTGGVLMSVRNLLSWRRVRRAGALAAVFAVAFTLYVLLAPLPELDDELSPAGTVVLAANGTVLQRDAKAGVRIPVTLEQVAPVAVQATISAEDQHFERHPGIDLLAIGRAVLHLGSAQSGASTITQQLARRLYLDGGGGPLPLRKLREAVLALRIEAHNDKDDILAAYLNDVYYGRGAYGIEAAARLYFGTSAKNLDLARAALLAGLPQDPAGYDVDRHPEAARARQAYVLGRLRDDGKISREAEAAALAEDLQLLPEDARPIAPHFVEYALDEVARVRPDLAGVPGLVIETTLDAGLQAEAERSVAVRLEQVRRHDATNAAVVVLDPRDGALRTMVGSAGFDNAAIDGQVNMALALRQPGSALKPFLYAAAMERGYTAATPLLDVPTSFESVDGLYTPGNYDRRFHGVVTLRTALASSYNVPAVRTLNDIGISAFLDMANRVGLRSLTDSERYGLALTLGGGEVRLIDLATAYAVLADGGLRNEPYAVQRIRDGAGRVLYEHAAPPPARAISAAAAWVLTDILRDPDARIPGFGMASPLTASIQAAVKTGTTTGFRDNWTAGYTPERVVVVWVGNTDGRAMQDISGVDGAGPIWRDVIEAAAVGTSTAWPAPPPDVVRTTVCSPTGLLPGPDCPSPVAEWFVRGTEPRATERFYVRSSDGQLRIAPPPEARAWASDAGFGLIAPAAGSPQAGAGSPVRIVQPASGSVMYLSPELRSQQLLLRVTAAGANAIELRVDGVLAGQIDGPDASVPWVLEAGAHRIEATAVLADGSRASATATYEVKER